MLFLITACESVIISIKISIKLYSEGEKEVARQLNEQIEAKCLILGRLNELLLRENIMTQSHKERHARSLLKVSRDIRS